jgi:PncC family amidohydrolase
MARRLIAALRKAGATLAVAESCTGGLLGATITAVPGASDVFVGGLIAYSDDVKASQLGVPQALLRRQGAVSRECALAMAKTARKRFASTVAVSITGIAGPGGARPGKPVGTVWIAATGGTSVERVERFRFEGTRQQVRRQAVREALRLALLVAPTSARNQ